MDIITNPHVGRRAEASNKGCEQTVIDTYADKKTKQELKEINLLPKPLQGFEKARLALTQGTHDGAVKQISDDLSEMYKNRNNLIPRAVQAFFQGLNDHEKQERAWDRQHRRDNPMQKFMHYNPITQLVDGCAQALIPQEALTKTLSGTFRSLDDIKQVCTNPSDDNFYKARSTTARNIGPGAGLFMEQAATNVVLAAATDGLLKGAGALRNMAKGGAAALEPLTFTRLEANGLQKIQIPVNNQTKAAIKRIYDADQQRWQQLHESGQTVGTGWEASKLEIKNYQGQAYYELTSTKKYLHKFEDALAAQPRLKSAVQKSQPLLNKNLELQQAELKAKSTNQLTSKITYTAKNTETPVPETTTAKAPAIAPSESKGNNIYAPGTNQNSAIESTGTKAPSLAVKEKNIYPPGANKTAFLEHTGTQASADTSINRHSDLAKSKSAADEIKTIFEESATKSHSIEQGHTPAIVDSTEHATKLWRTTVNGEPMILMPVDKQSSALIENLFKCDQRHLKAFDSKQAHLNLIEENGQHFYVLSGSSKYLDYFEDKILSLHPEMKTAQFQLDTVREMMQTLRSCETDIIAPPSNSPLNLWRSKTAYGLQSMTIPVNEETEKLIGEIYANASGLQGTKLDLIHSRGQEFFEFRSSKVDADNFEKALANHPQLGSKLKESQLAMEAKLALYKQEVLERTAKATKESTKPSLVAHQH